MEVLRFNRGPKVIGPYSSAVKSGNLIFFSGILPMIPETGEMVTNDIAKATKQILENLLVMLEQIGLSPRQVVKTTIFTTKLDEFSKINEVYEEFFKSYTENYPARSTVGVQSLPKNATVEMEFIVEC
ncbi:MAG: Rid family detoxifying hydrolase [Fervidobacterium sp.]